MSGYQNPLADWVRLFASRDELVVEYAALIRDKPPSWTGWRVLNLAITDRWSPSALRYIKRKAWEQAQGEKP